MVQTQEKTRTRQKNQKSNTKSNFGFYTSSKHFLEFFLREINKLILIVSTTIFLT